MTYRFMFKGYLKDKDYTYIENSGASHISLSCFDDMVFLYFEAHEEYVDPETVVKCNLKEYPDGTHWERMTEIFHYCDIVSDEQWERKIPDKKPVIRINSLKYEKIASYIFYHHQYQEKTPCDGDKYGVIFLSGNLMVFYMETPQELQEPKLEPNMLPGEVPECEWQALMDKHFLESPKIKRWMQIENL